TVNPVNDAPVAVDDAVTTDEDVPLVISVQDILGNDTDADGDSLMAELVSGPEHGTLTQNADGSFTYTPDADYNGTDSFTYKAADSTSDSNAATVSITVNPVNDAPVAVDDVLSIAFAQGSGGPETASSTPVVHETSGQHNGFGNAQLIDRTALKIAPNADVGDDSLPSLTIHGEIDQGQDGHVRDRYKIELKAGETIVLDVDHASLSLDPIVRIYDATHSQVGQN